MAEWWEHSHYWNKTLYMKSHWILCEKVWCDETKIEFLFLDESKTFGGKYVHHPESTSMVVVTSHRGDIFHQQKVDDWRLWATWIEPNTGQYSTRKKQTVPVCKKLKPEMEFHLPTGNWPYAYCHNHAVVGQSGEPESVRITQSKPRAPI